MNLISTVLTVQVKLLYLAKVAISSLVMDRFDSCFDKRSLKTKQHFDLSKYDLDNQVQILLNFT